jgi:flagellar biosynthesis protein FliR
VSSPLLPLAAGFLLIVLRCASLFVVVPLYGMPAIPMRIRMAAALSVSTVVFMGAGAPGFAAWDQADRVLLAAVTETFLGLAVGMVARLVLDAAAAAGSAIGVCMSLSMSATYDPVHGSESPAVAQMLSLTALAFAVAAGIHREAIAWLCRSVIDVPPGAPYAMGPLAARVVGQGAEAMALAIRLAFPVLSAVTIGHLTLGLLNRTIPQLGISNVGFAVAILAGMGSLYLAAPAAARLVAEAARSAFASG